MIIFNAIMYSTEVSMVFAKIAQSPQISFNAPTTYHLLFRLKINMLWFI